MSQVCDLCGKGPTSGQNRSHSNQATKRVFKPNLHSKKLKVGGTSMKIKMCSTCLKTLSKQ
ncbi:MAG: 50S ribosomal protein L28 [Candidatus Gracilibacteria bacterium]|nr:50S ribosomal protein L28 [Candidatus Gracilibacteria bacterium]